MSDLKISELHKEMEEKIKTYEIIHEMLAERYELNCGKVSENSTNPDLFFAIFFREPSDWRDNHKHLYLESINWYENAGHGKTLLEAVEEAREITLRKGL